MRPGILRTAIGTAFSLPGRLGAGSIAFPAISTGIYGYPREKAARVAWDEISKFITANPVPHTVSLVFYSADDERVFLDNAPHE